MLVVLALVWASARCYGAVTLDLNLAPSPIQEPSSDLWSGLDMLAKAAAATDIEMKSVDHVDTPLAAHNCVSQPTSIPSLFQSTPDPFIFVFSAEALITSSLGRRSRPRANRNRSASFDYLPFSDHRHAQSISISDMSQNLPASFPTGATSINGPSPSRIQAQCESEPNHNPCTSIPRSLPANTISRQHKTTSEPSQSHSHPDPVPDHNVQPSKKRRRRGLKMTSNNFLDKDPNDCLLTLNQENDADPTADDQVDNRNRIEIPNLLVPRKAPVMEKVDLIRQHYDLYKQYADCELTKRSREFRRSMWHFINCFDHPKHCGKSEEEFHRRHPSFCSNVTEFHRRFCDGTSTCHYDNKLKKRAVKKLKSHGSFVIPRLSLPRTPSGEIIYSDLLEQARSRHAQFGHIPRSELTYTSQVLQLAVRHILHCFDEHCKKDVDTFAKKHRRISPGLFTVFNCSSFRQECNYIEKHQVYIKYQRKRKEARRIA